MAFLEWLSFITNAYDHFPKQISMIPLLAGAKSFEICKNTTFVVKSASEAIFVV